MPSLQVPPTKNGPRKHSKDAVDTVENLDTKQLIVPTRKATKIRARKSKTNQKKKQHSKGDSKGEGHLDMSKINCFNCGEYGHFDRDCPKACDNANIAQESEQKGKMESMLDLDSTSVSEECAMVCTELQYEDASENEVVYGDQGISAEEYEKTTYNDFMKTESEEEDEVKCTVAQRANNSVILERKRRCLKENDPDKKSENCNQSEAPINEISTVNSINESMSEVQGPTDDNNKNKSRKAWTMEMLMNGGNISANMMNEEVSMSDDERMYLYARVVHSNHSIQYHMHQIMERQKVIDEYRNMTMEGMDLIPLESNLHNFIR